MEPTTTQNANDPAKVENLTTKDIKDLIKSQENINSSQQTTEESKKEEDKLLFSKIESYLLKKIAEGDKNSSFLLAQFYYEEGKLEEALEKFEEIKDNDFQAMYQLATMYYDGIGCEKDEKKGFAYMMKVAQSSNIYAAHLIYAARYNVGKAYFEGFGTKQSDEEAERWWLAAAADGDPKASVDAQSMLGMYYSRPEFLNLRKSFFWHSEACGNGSLESQGILGVMYMEGKGIKKNMENAFQCLKEASDRGNVYAQGRLVQLYFEKKLYTKACDLARNVVAYKNVDKIAEETGCLCEYIVKGIALACYYLSRCLFFGKGMKRSVKESHKFLNKLCELDPVLAFDCQMDMTYGYS